MPGIHIHLAIAKEYIKHHPEIKSQEAFFEGSIAPDFNEDKKKSHYTKDTSNKDLINYLNNKHFIDFIWHITQFTIFIGCLINLST